VCSGACFVLADQTYGAQAVPPSPDWCNRLVHRLEQVARTHPNFADLVLKALVKMFQRVAVGHIFAQARLPVAEVIMVATQAKTIPVTFVTVSSTCNPWDSFQALGGFSWELQAMMVNSGIVGSIYRSLMNCSQHPDDFRVLSTSRRRSEVLVFGAVSPYVAWAATFLHKLCQSLNTHILSSAGSTDVATYLNTLQLDDHSFDYFQRQWREESPLLDVRWLKFQLDSLAFAG
jgi:hypothetical protein